MPALPKHGRAILHTARSFSSKRHVTKYKQVKRSGTPYIRAGSQEAWYLNRKLLLLLVGTGSTGAGFGLLYYRSHLRFEEKYKAFERLGEEVELIKKWEKDIQYKLEHPVRVLIQLKEVSRIKLQHMELLEEIKSKGAVISKMEQDLVQVKGDMADSPQSMELTDKLKVVREAYTVILKTAKNQNHDLQETMDRVEKVVYWYNCLQQYLKNSRKRLELLDPLATDVADVSKQLKLCKALTTELESKEELIEEMMKESEQLLQLANKDHLYIVPADLGDKVTSFRADWKKFCSKCKTQEKRLERTYTKLRKLETALEKILRWQQDKEKELEAAPPISSDLAIIKQQLEQIKSLRAIVDGCESHITTANELARSLINRGKAPQDSIPPLKAKLEKINEGWCRMDATITSRLYDLEAALKRSQGIEKALEDLKAWLIEKETQLGSKDTLSLEHDTLQESLSKYTEMKRDIHGYENVVATTAEKALLSLTPDDRDQMKVRLDGLQYRYRTVREDCETHQDKLSEVYQGVDNLRRNVSSIQNTLERCKDSYSEMGAMATNIASLKEQHKEVVVFVNSMEAVIPDIASVVKEGDLVSDFALLQQYPKLQREVLQLPQTLQTDHKSLSEQGSGRKREVEERMEKLANIDDLLEKFYDRLSNKQNELSKMLEDHSIDIEGKNRRIDGFTKDHADLAALLDKVKDQVSEVISDEEETPFLKRRLAEADQKLGEFEKRLTQQQQGLSDLAEALAEHDTERLTVIEEISAVEVECGKLEPISATVSQATAQTLQNMNLIESCNALKRKQADLKDSGAELAMKLPPPLKEKMETEGAKADERLEKLGNRLKSRMDALDGVLPFITHLQDLEKDLLPWLEDTERAIKSQSTKPASVSNVDQIKAKIAKIGGLMAEVESHQCDVEDAALFGESALELVNGYDAVNVCPTVKSLEVHLRDVQDRYAALIVKLKEDNDELGLKFQLSLDLTRFSKDTDAVGEYLTALPEPRLNENDLKQFISDIDEKLADIAVLEQQLTDLCQTNPAAADSDDVKALKARLAGLKVQLKEKKCALTDKCDTLELLTADIDDVLNAIKGAGPALCKVPLSDVKSVQAHQDAQQHLTPIIEGIEEKLAKLQEVYQTIAKDCNPIDAKRLETKISDLKQKCAEKEKKKQEKLAELQHTKDQLNKLEGLSSKLREYLSAQLEDLSNAETPSNTAERLKEQLEEHKAFTEAYQKEGPEQLKELMKLAHMLRDEGLDSGAAVDDKVKSLQKLYDELTNAAAKRQQELEALMIEAQNVKDTLDYILPWLYEAEQGLLTQGKPGAEIETVTLQQEKQKVDQQAVLAHADLINSLKDQSGLMEEDVGQLEEVLAKWEHINELHNEKREELSTAFDHLLEFEKVAADLSSFISQTETDILEASQIPLSDVQIVEDMISKHKSIQESIVTKSSDLELCNGLGEDYKPLTDQPDIITDKLEEINKRWDWLKELLESLLRDLDDAMGQLMNKLKPEKEDTGLTDTLLH